MKLPKFKYIAPKSVKEASSLLKEYGDRAIALAGGSDLLVNLKNRLKNREFLIDLKAIPRMDRVTFSEPEGLTIGAMATLRDLIEIATVRENYPMLVQAAESVGTPQVQYMGTVAGNLCLDNRCYYYNQSPWWHAGREACWKLGGRTCYTVRGSKTCWATYCGDTAPALLALGAKIKVAEPAGEKTMPLQELYSGDGENPTTLKAGQFITEITIPLPAGGSGGAYLKLRRRQAINFPLLGVAVNLRLNGKRSTCEDARIALTAVERKPILIEEALMLKGGKLNEAAIAEVLEAAHNQAHPVDNLSGLPPSYRKKMVKIYLAKAINQALQAAQRKGK
ncbi:MAG: xanthine dehydrogenase family protein subunit M [Desulfobacterales bacterium]|nr:xanthine dehydrogenase family protein subunit M [Desulfobacterales bacterium]